MNSTTNTHFEREKRRRGAIKHGILRSFTDGWFPCMTRAYSEKLLVYVDGFAGAGKHSNSENDVGSPLLLCDALARHNQLERNASCLMIFTEKDKRTYEKLVKNISENMTAHNNDRKVEFVFEYESETFQERMIEANTKFLEWRGGSSLEERPKIFVIVENGEFNEKMTQILDEFSNNPMFIFADPFGWNVPMETFHKILRTSNYSAPKDLLINFMDGNIRRFIASENHEDSLRKLMGECTPPPNRQWHHLSPDEKLDRIYDEYVRNMKEYCVTDAQEGEDVYFCSRRELLDLKFAIRNKNNAHVYHLVFFCTHVSSLKKMKSAMNKNSQDYKEFGFSEWIKWNVYRDLPTEKKEMALDTIDRIRTTFTDPFGVMGATLEDFIWKRTPYHFNFKNELKRQLRNGNYLVDTPENMKLQRKFEVIAYNFGGTIATAVEAEVLEVEPSAMPISNMSINDIMPLVSERINDSPHQENVSVTTSRKRQAPESVSDECAERVAMKRRNV